MKKIAIILTTAILALQANTFTITDKVRVTNSTPAYKTITQRIPYQECWDESVPVEHSNGYTDDYPIGTIIGGVAGGVIGHQVGGGRGKDLATVGGAIIGSIVGHNMSRKHKRNNYRTYETKQRCVTRYNENEEEKFIGYKNIGYYKGKRIVKISDRRLRYIPINIKVRY
jgi:uncharacterized protein YcfJ